MYGETLKQLIGIPIGLLIFWAINPITWIYYAVKWLRKND
jgi:hypothetical protein